MCSNTSTLHPVFHPLGPVPGTHTTIRRGEGVSDVDERMKCHGYTDLTTAHYPCAIEMKILLA